MICRYVDQGGGKRKGAFAIYLEPWHADIFDWLNLRKNHGKEEVREFSISAILILKGHEISPKILPISLANYSSERSV